MTKLLIFVKNIDTIENRRNIDIFNVVFQAGSKSREINVVSRLIKKQVHFRSIMGKHDLFIYFFFFFTFMYNY